MRENIRRAIVALAVLAVMTPLASAQQQWADAIKGQVIYAGKPRDIKDLPVDKDKEHCLAKGALKEDVWLINKDNKGLQNVVIWLAPAPGGTLPVHEAIKDPPKNPVVIDQPCCMFEPRVSAARVGQEVKVLNPAPVAHNISWKSIADPGGNVIIPAGKDYTIKQVSKTRLPYEISCTIHPWMTGKLAVFDHPYFAITDKDGRFEIPKPPAGKYKLFVWHESGWLNGAAGSKGYDVDIPAGKTFEVPADKLKWLPTDEK